VLAADLTAGARCGANSKQCGPSSKCFARPSHYVGMNVWRRQQAVSQPSVLPQTGDNNEAAVIEPYAFDRNFRGDTEPAILALKGEGYHVDVLKNTVLTDEPKVTIDTFFQKINHAAVVVVDTHGVEVAPLIEVYETEKARDAAWNGYMHKGWKSNELYKTRSHHDTDYDIGIRGLGFAKKYHGASSFVYFSACFSSAIGGDMRAHGARQFFGYSTSVPISQGTKDFKEFWSLLDGSQYEGRADGIPPRVTNVALSVCTEHSLCTDAVLFGKPMVLAPSVDLVQPTGDLTAGDDFTVTIGFNAQMRQNPPSSILDVSGCGVQAGDAGKWGNAIRFSRGYGIADKGTLSVSVLSGSGKAESATNKSALDGNVSYDTPKKGDGPVRPNGDPYTFQLTCKPKPTPTVAPTKTPAVLEPTSTPTAAPLPPLLQSGVGGTYYVFGGKYLNMNIRIITPYWNGKIYRFACPVPASGGDANNPEPPGWSISTGSNSFTASTTSNPLTGNSIFQFETPSLPSGPLTCQAFDGQGNPLGAFVLQQTAP
jgi:hypothetical protein